MLNWLGLLSSYVFVFAFMGLAALLQKRRVLSPADTRKVIHIGVAHWWIIAMATMSSPLVASIGPASFILINILTLRLGLLPAMDAAAGRGNLGTVWFPVSLLVLVNLCWRGIMPAWMGGVGVLTMGWGDGLAALVGERLPRPGLAFWGGRKSLAGTTAMFAASLVVGFVFLSLFARGAGVPRNAGAAAATAAVSTAVEVLTPLGLDNLTVPLASSFFLLGVFA
jgi:phytol kinase